MISISVYNNSNCIFFQGIPRDVNFNVVQDTFLGVDGIVAVHNLRIWGLSTDKVALAAHLAIGKFLKLFLVLLRQASFSDVKTLRKKSIYFLFC